MNYRNADEERIRKQRELQEQNRQKVAQQKNLENKTYSGKSLDALAKGQYSSLRNNTTNKVPELKPSSKYNNQNVVANQPQKSTRDTRFDNDFDNFFNYRYGDFSGEVDYDPVTDTDVESWRNVKKDIMRKNKWSDKEFEDKFKAYSDERYKKMGDEIIASSVETAKKHPFLGTLQQAILNPGVWLEGAANMVSGLPFVPDKYKAQSADDPMFLSSRQKEAIKQTVKDEHIKSNVGKGAYDIGTGLADMVMSAGVPVLGAATLGTETASRNQRQALERGADPNKAALTGLATGVVSGAMNKVGLDKALASNTIRGAMNKEGLENILEDVATLGIDKAINKNKSQLNAMHDYYASQGMDDQSAWTQVIKDTGLDLATSYGTGAAFGGVMSGLNRLPSLLGGRNNTPDIPNDPNVPAVTGDATIDNAIKQTADAEAEIQRLSEQIPKVPEVVNESAPTLTPEDQAALQTELANEGYNWSDEPISANNTNTHSKDGHLLSNAKIPEYTMKEDVYFNGSDDDIILAEAQDQAIVDTFKNIITDPEFNALSFKNGNKEVFVSPATNGNGLRMSYTIDGVPTGHHDYSLDQIDDLSRNLRNEAGNGGKDIRIQRKSDIAKQSPSNVTNKVTINESVAKANAESFNGYKVGDKVTYSTDDFDGKSSTESIIKEVYPDHMIVDVPGLSDHVWIDNDTMDMVKSSKSNNPITKIDQIKEGIKAKDFRPVTFVNNEGHTYIISKSTRPGEKWQLSHIDDTGRPKGHSAFSNDNDLLATLDKVNTDNIANVGGDTILNQGRTTIGDMLNNPDDYSLDDFKRAVRAYDTNADVDGVEKEDIIAFFNNEAEGNSDVLTSNIPINRLVNNNTSETNTNINESASKNPTITSKPLEGAEREAAQSKFNDLSKKLTQKNREIAVQKEIANKAKGKTKTAENKKLKALQAEAKEIQNSKKELRRQLDGKPVPVKEILAEQNKDLHDRIFQRKTGLIDNINYVAKHAGDTAEAKQLSKDIQKSIKDFVETGDISNTLYSPETIEKINRLDDLAKTVDAEYIGHYADNVLFTDNEGNPSIWNALEGVDDEPGITSQIGRFHDEHMRTPDSTSAPTTTSMDPAHELAGRYAAAYQGFDTYDYMDNIFENDSFEESMANDIQNGRDLTGYIDALEEIIDDAPDEGTRAEMQSLIDELTTLNEGRVPTDGKLTPEEVSRLQDIADGKEDIPETGNEVPNVKPTEPTPPNNNVPSVTPPGNNPPKTSISQRYETLKKSDLFTKSEANMKMLETGKKQGVFDKDIENRKQTQEEALNDYLNNKEEVTKRNLERQWDSGKDVDTSMLILNDVLNEGDQAKVNLTLLKQAEQSKGAGRILRANRDYVGTKEGTIQKAGEYLNDKADRVLSSKKTKNQFEAMAERIVNGDLSELSSKLNMDEANIDNIRKAVKAGAGQADIVKMIGMYQAVGKTGISPEALKKISDIYDAIQDKKLNPNSKKRADLEADAFKVLADDIGGKRTWKEQWDAWRYLAMLGNPKTHLRNVLGNATHYAVTEAKDNIGAVLEGAVDKVSRKGINRTKSILTNADKNLVDMAAKDADDVAYSALNDGKNKYNVKEEIDRARSTFNNKVLSKIDDLNSNALDVEDYTALKRKYSKSLARYLKANGADASIFGKTDENSSALLEKARAYAIDQAKQATFHEYSKMAERLNQFSKGLREGNAAEKVAGMAVEGLVPFKKTPINILKQGFKYSPVSLAKAVGKTVDAIRTGNSSASDAIEDLAAGMTGTMVMALGGFLAHQGLLTGGANENYDVDNAETEQGAQNYAIKIGNNSYTLDWLAPVSLPLFVGAELYNMSAKDNGEDEDNIDKFVTALSTIAEPVTEMSMLQGIQNMLNELSYSKENVFGTIAANTTLGYASQGIPTLAGQVARAIDPTRRSTYSDQKVGVKRQFDKALTKTKNKIPFLTQSQQPYVNASGEEQTNEGLFSSMLGDNFGTRLADQMLSPGYYKKGTVTKVDEELNRLYEATGENVYKNVSSGKVKDERLSKEDFTKYQKLYGSNNDKLYNAIVGSSDYNKLDDAERVKTITNIKNISKMIADHEIGGKELENSQQKIYDIYKTKGIDGITQYIRDKANADALGIKYDTYMKKESEQPGSAAQYAQDKQKLDAINDKYGTNIQMSTLEKYGVDGAEQRAQGTIDAKNYGFVDKEGNANVDAYTKAVDMFGNDQKSLRAYSDFRKQGLKKNAQMIPALMNNNQFTDKQKGQVIMAEHGYKYDDLGNTAKGAYDREGEAGVYYFYLLKNLADTQYGDGNGSVKKAEKVALMNSDNPNVTKLSDDMYYYLGNAKW